MSCGILAIASWMRRCRSSRSASRLWPFWRPPRYGGSLRGSPGTMCSYGHSLEGKGFGVWCKGERGEGVSEAAAGGAADGAARRAPPPPACARHALALRQPLLADLHRAPPRQDRRQPDVAVGAGAARLQRRLAEAAQDVRHAARRRSRCGTLPPTRLTRRALGAADDLLPGGRPGGESPGGRARGGPDQGGADEGFEEVGVVLTAF
jgi:hypothetical protein